MSYKSKHCKGKRSADRDRLLNTDFTITDVFTQCCLDGEKKHQKYHWIIKWRFIIQHKKYNLSQKNDKKRVQTLFKFSLCMALRH